MGAHAKTSPVNRLDRNAPVPFAAPTRIDVMQSAFASQKIRRAPDVRGRRRAFLRFPENGSGATLPLASRPEKLPAGTFPSSYRSTPPAIGKSSRARHAAKVPPWLDK